MSKKNLRTLLNEGFVAAPGIPDMMGAVVANKIGFDVVYGSGFWNMASAHGLPDAGIATYTQMVDRMRTIATTCDGLLIADADTGYGGLLNVHHTVRGYEEAGVVGIQLEDQTFPKMCGHTPNRGVVELEEMVDKVQVACEARQNPEDTLIIARTDSLQTEGFDASIKRCEAYADAGADIIFLEALTTEQQMEEACDAIDRPMMVNMANGGVTPILNNSKLEEVGFSLAIWPALNSLSALAAMEKGMRILKEKGTTNDPDLELFEFKEFCEMIGFPEVWEFEDRWVKKIK